MSEEPAEQELEGVEEADSLEDEDADASPAANKKQRGIQDSDDEEGKPGGEAAAGEGEGDGPAEGEAEEDEDEDGESADSSDEEDDEAPNEYEKDDFMVDEVEDEEGGGGGGEGDERRRRKKKRRKRGRDFLLDDEDYDLVQEAGVEVRRPGERKRLKKRAEGDRGDRGMGRAQLQEHLFGGAGGDLEDELADLADDEPRQRSGRAAEERGQGLAANDGYGELSDEFDDFIDDGDRGNWARRKQRARTNAVAARSGLDPQALQQAARVFGDVSDIMELYESRAAERQRGEADVHMDSEEGSELSEEDLAGEEELPEGDVEQEAATRRAAARQQARRQARRRAKLEKLVQRIGREEAAARYLLPEDLDIRDTDLPERHQLERARLDLGSLPSTEREQFLDGAAAWVHATLFSRDARDSLAKDLVAEGRLEVTGLAPGLSAEEVEDMGDQAFEWSRHDIAHIEHNINLRLCKALTHSRDSRNSAAWLQDQERDTGPGSLRANIRAVLERLFVRGEEVPIIGMFRPDVAGHLAALRKSDCPDVTGQDGRLEEVSDRWPLGSIQPKHRRVRRWEALWAVWAAGLRYCDLATKRTARIEALHALMDSHAGDHERDLLVECIRAAEAAESLQGLDDASVKANVLLGGATQAAEVEGGPRAGNRRGPTRTTLSQRLRATGVAALLVEVCLPAEDFATNVEADDMTIEPPEPSERPLEWAEAKLRSGMVQEVESAQGLLDRLTDLMAEALAVEPVLRKGLRLLFWSMAKISTEPTQLGAGVLDPFHPYGIAKRLKFKPIDHFAGTDTWLRVAAAEQDKLITLSWDLGSMEEDMVAAAFRTWGETTGVSEAATEWREVRRAALRKAVTEKLTRMFKKEAMTRLAAEAQEVVLDAIGERLWDYLKRPPLRLMVLEEKAAPDTGGREEQLNPGTEEVLLAAPRIMAVAWGSNQEPEGPTALVLLDEHGNLKDLARLPQLSGRIPRTVSNIADRGGGNLAEYDPCIDAKKSKDATLVRTKVLEGLPHALLVGAGHPHAAQLKDDLGRVILHMESTYPGWAKDHETKGCEVLWGDEALAALWANSEAAGKEYGDHHPLVRKAIALARLALEPLAVACALASSPGCELASLRLHELQGRLPKEMLVGRMTQLLVTAVAQVGVDINLAIAQPWRQPLLPYVPGLGPRKAAQLLRYLSGGTPLWSRLELKAPAPGIPANRRTQVLGPCVYGNASACIRVRASSEAANNGDFSPQDDMRLHVECELALDWLAKEVVAAAHLEPVGTSEEPELAALLDEKGGREAVANNYDPWEFTGRHALRDHLLTWHDVGAELMAPYAELRPPWERDMYSQEAVFYMLHGEPPNGRLRGRLVEARVHWVGGREAKCYVEPGNMEVLLLPSDVTATHNRQEGGMEPRLSDYVQAGQIVSARIWELGAGYDQRDVQAARSMEDQKYPVYITVRSDDLQDMTRWEQEYCRDKYYVTDTTAANAARERAGGSRARPKGPALIMRKIDHPDFENISMEEALKRLADKPPGSVQFRPTQRRDLAEALSRINATFKLADTSSGPLWAHVELREAPKLKNDRRLKLPVKISWFGAPGTVVGQYGQASKEGEVAYDDLDEVIARYVEPLMVHATALQTHRKWAAGDKAAVDTVVLKEQTAAALASGNPDATAYCIALDFARPLVGYIAAVFKRGMTPAREPFVLTPDGFWFRNTMHRDVEHMLNAFKKDPQYLAKQRQQLAGGQGYQHAPGAMGTLGYGGQNVYGSQAPGAGYAQGYSAPAAAAGGYSTGVAAYGGGYGMPAAAAMAGPGHPQAGMMGGYQQQAPAAGYPQSAGPANGAGMVAAGAGSGYGGGYQGGHMGAGQQQQQQMGGYPGPPAGYRR